MTLRANDSPTMSMRSQLGSCCELARAITMGVFYTPSPPPSQSLCFPRASELWRILHNQRSRSCKPARTWVCSDNCYVSCAASKDRPSGRLGLYRCSALWYGWGEFDATVKDSSEDYVISSSGAAPRLGRRHFRQMQPRQQSRRTNSEQHQTQGFRHFYVHGIRIGQY